MEANRRIGLAPVPADLEVHLNQAQKTGLDKAENFGWAVKFVRRATVVMVYEDGETLGVLEADGTLNQETRVRERNSTAPSKVPPAGFKPNKFLV